MFAAMCPSDPGIAEGLPSKLYKQSRKRPASELRD